MPAQSPLVVALVLASMAGTAAFGALYWRQRHRSGRLQHKLRDARSRAKEASLRDSATGALSRRGFDKHLAALSTRGHDGPLSLLCIGLDGLRLVQDTQGSACVEKLLSQVVQRLAGAGGPDCAVARLGPDQFALVDSTATGPCVLTARRVREAVARPFTFEGDEVRLTCSVGVAAGTLHQAPQLLSRAAVAMSTVSQAGGDDHALFDPRMAADQRDQAQLVRDLRRAIERQEFELFYQPKVDARSLQVTAAEALLRWRHADRGMVSPAVFIPLAERHGLIGTVGDWVLDRALEQAAAWRKIGLRMRVAINVSGYQMRQDDFAARLESGLRRHDLHPGRFTCEITESVAMEHTAVTHRAFARLGKLGVHVSIDDFGTGHSSLASLRRLPASELKIDRSFVADLAESVEARTIAQAIVQMAHTLQLRVVAEGVETEAQRDLLMAMGCDEMQGYLFAKPMSARALGLWAMEAPATTLPQAFRPSLFKETRPVRSDTAPL